MVGVIALGLRIGFTHILAGLCFSVILGAIAVVGLGFRVDPNFSIPTASRRSCRGRGFIS